MIKKKVSELQCAADKLSWNLNQSVSHRKSHKLQTDIRANRSDRLGDGVYIENYSIFGVEKVKYNGRFPKSDFLS